MQPYFLPYIGYYQLMHSVDVFVVYDDIKYTKKGWINRNRFLMQGKPAYMTLPLAKGSDYLDIRERMLSDDYANDAMVISRRLQNAYNSCDFRSQGLELVNRIFAIDKLNLFEFLYESIVVTIERLQLDVTLIKSSEVVKKSEHTGQDRVIEICRALDASAYVNPIGGLELYDPVAFEKAGIDLQFHEMKHFRYSQPSESFVSHLSIIDSVMCVGFAKTACFVATEYRLIRKHHAI